MSSLVSSLVLSVLTRYLGDFVEEINSDSFKLSVAAGDASLEHLTLRQSALSDLNLPVVVRCGHLQHVRIVVPWSSLGSDAAVIEISGVFLLAGPREDSDYDPAEALAKAHTIKMQRVALAQMLVASDDGGEAGGAANKEDNSYTGRMMASILNNLQVKINNVHVRYEDATTCPERPFVCGLTLRSFHAVTVDSQWQPCIVEGGSAQEPLMHKLVTLQELSMYWTSGGAPLLYDSAEHLGEQLAQLISAPHLGYLLEPLSGQLRAVMNRSGVPDLHTPKYSLSFALQQISVALRDDQFQDFVSIAHGFRLAARRAPYSDLRPQRNPRADPRAWWRYACAVVQRRRAEERSQWSWERMQRRRRARLEYVGLFCDSRGASTAQLEQLELELSYEDIVMYRQLGRELLKKKAVAAASEAPPEAGGWFSWLGAGVQAATEVTPELLEQLYETVDYSPLQDDQALPEYVKNRVSFTLESGKICLSKQQHVFTEASFKNFEAQIEARLAGSGNFEASLGSISILDHSSLPGTTIPILVSSADQPKVLALAVQVKPLEGVADYRVMLEVSPVNCVVSRPYTERMLGFFVVEHSEELTRATGASEKLEAWQRHARAQLRHALDAKKTVEVRLQVREPRLFVPEDITRGEGAAVLAVSLGGLGVSSRPRAQDSFYDEFSVDVPSLRAQVFYVGCEWNWSSPTVPQSAVNLVDPVALQFLFGRALINAPHIAATKLSTTVPRVKAYLSVESFTKTIACIRTIVDEEGEGPPAEDVEVVYSVDDILAVRLQPDQVAVNSKVHFELRIDEASVDIHHQKSNAVVATLNLDAFTLRVIKMEQQQIRVFVALHGLHLMDSENSSLARSVVGGESEDNLISLTFLSVSRTADVYKGIDYEVDLHIGNLQCLCLRDVVVQLIDFGNDLLAGLSDTAPKPLAASDTVAVRTSREQGVFLNLRFRVDVFEIQFNYRKVEDQPLAEVRVTSWDQMMTFRNDDTWRIIVSVGSSTLSDLRPLAARYSRVLSVKGSQCLHFTFETFTELTKGADAPSDVVGYDTLLTFKVLDMKYVYVQNFVTEFIKYFKETHALHAMLVSSYAKAQGLAANPTVEEQHMKMDITLISPEITIPRNYDSKVAFVAHSSLIQVSDDWCVSPDQIYFNRDIYVIDALSLKLKKTHILQDTNLRLQKESPPEPYEPMGLFPATRWDVTCSAVNLMLTLDQASQIFATVDENLCGERTTQAYHEYRAAPVFYGAAAEPTKSPSKVYSSPRTFNVDEYNVNLSMMSLQIFSEPHKPFSSFFIHSMVGSMVSENNGRSLMHFTFESVELLDIRYGVVNEFPVLLSSKSRGKQQLQLTRVSYPSGDQEYMLNMEHPRIVLTPWAYEQLWDVIWPLFSDSLKSWDLWVNDGVVIEEPAAPTAEWAMRVTISEPEMVFVAEPSDPHCQALFVKGTVLYKHVEPPTGGKHVSIHTRQLEAFRCCLADEEGTQTMLLEPTDCTILYKWFPEDLSQTWDVHFPQMYLTLSYRDALMLSTLYRMWWPVEENTENPELVPFTPIDLQQLALESATEGSSSSSNSAIEDESSHEGENELIDLFSTPKRSTSISADESSTGLGDSIVENTTYKIESEGMIMRFVNDLAEHVPVALFNLHTANLTATTSELVTKSFLQCELVLELYNAESQAWEPLVEPWLVEGSFTRAHELGTKISLLAERLLSINLTEQAMVTLLRTWNDLSEDWSAPAAPFSASGVGLATSKYSSCNVTGRAAWVWCSGVFDDELIEIPVSGETVPLDISHYNKQQPGLYGRAANKAPAPRLSVKVEGDFKVARDYPLGELGTYLLQVDPSARTRLVMEVKNSRGSRMLKIRSNVQLHNELPVALEFEGHYPGAEPAIWTTVAPGDTVALPVDYLHGRVRVRPVEGYLFSEQGIPIADLAPSSFLILCGNAREGRSGEPFAVFCVVEEQTLAQDLLVTFCSPYVLENLLPCEFQLRIVNKQSDPLFCSSVESGASAKITVDVRQKVLLSLRLPNFHWSEPGELNGARAVSSLELMDKQQNCLSVSVRYWRFNSGVTKISVFCDYHVVNESGVAVLFAHCSLNKRILLAGQLQALNILEDDSSSSSSSASNDHHLFEHLPFQAPNSRRMAIRAPGETQWSAPFSLRVSTNPIPLRSGHYQFSVSVERGRDKFWRTLEVRLVPQLVVVNALSTLPLRYSQQGSGEDYVLAVHDQVGLHWGNAHCEELLIVKPNVGSYDWCPAFHPVKDLKLTLKARSVAGGTLLLKVRTLVEGGTLIVIFEDENPECPSYRVSNTSGAELTIRQYGLRHGEQLAPGASVSYAWDDPTITPLLLEVIAPEPQSRRILVDMDAAMGFFNTDDPDNLLDITKSNGDFHAVVFPEGPTKSVTVKYGAAVHAFVGMQLPLEVDPWALQVTLAGLGLSFVNDEPLELVYASFKEISLDYEKSSKDQTVSFTIERIQIDNCSFQTQYPVLLWAPSLHISFSYAPHYATVHYFRHFSMMISDMDIQLDDEVFLKCWDFFVALSDAYTASLLEEEDAQEVQQWGVYQFPAEVAAGEVAARTQYFLKEVNVRGTKILISFLNTDSGNSKSITAASRIIRTMGALANIERSPLELPEFTGSDLFWSREEIDEKIYEHYATGLRKEMTKIIASSDFLGAPGALVGNVREGFRDFVTRPGRMADAEGAAGAVKGVGIGTKNLLKSGVYGTFNSISKISGTVGNSMSVLALDEDYERERDRNAKRRPKHVGEGILFGARDLGIGLWRGVTGVFTEPVKGAKEEGVAGFFKGVSRGVTGLYVKPAVGTIDFITRTTEGVKHTAEYWEGGERTRLRLPRHFGSDSVLQVFNTNDAEGQWLLYRIADQRFFEVVPREHFKYRFMSGKDTIIVTERTLICCRGLRLLWAFPMIDIERLEYNRQQYAEGLCMRVRGQKKTFLICCVTDNLNLSREMLKTLNKLLQHKSSQESPSVLRRVKWRPASKPKNLTIN